MKYAFLHIHVSQGHVTDSQAPSVMIRIGDNLDCLTFQLP